MFVSCDLHIISLLMPRHAMQSVIDLGGRFFGGRTVAATFFDEDRFDKQELAPKAGEFEC